jgi:hypothetical protein
MTENLLTGTIEEVAEQAQRILASMAPGTWCQAQEWDGRIDCGIKLPDGSVVAEMILLRDATEARIKEAGERLLKRQKGIAVALHNELPPPILISRSPTK